MDEQNLQAEPESAPVEPIQDDEGTTTPPKSDGSSAPTSFAATLQSVTDQALHFLSHASNETLGACLVGLSATTYLVLGRVGLVFIGVAGGVVLHATWEGVRHDDRDEETKRAEQKRRREAGVEVARRLLEWRKASADAEDGQGDTKVYANQQLDFSEFGPETELALNTFTNAVIKDYVHYWYDPTLPGELSFPASCRRTLTAFLLSISGHLKRKRPADAFLDFVTNASSIIIVFLNELSAALNASPNHSAEDAVATYLALKPDSSLSYMLDQNAQNAKLANAAEDILQAYLDPKAYNCSPVHVFLKQVLAQLILGYTVTYCSKPEFINEWIVYGLEESETTKEVMDIVDAGVDGRPSEERARKVESPAEAQEIVSRKAAAAEIAKPERPVGEHKRQTSKAEEAMDEAMKEARRLTQLMIEEDERRAREEQERLAAVSSSEDVSDANTQGVATPTSSQSDRDRQDEEASAWGRESSTAAESSITSNSRPATPTTKQQFTSFDQILPQPQPTALVDSPTRSRSEPAQLTLHNANISIFDDSVPGERTSIKAKPVSDYLIQIEPSNSLFPGWMIARKYADFEMLHEVLRRISVITGVHGFAQSHTELPKWKTNTKAALRSELERYLTDAVRFQPLAESEGMKRFLEKDQGQSKSPSERKGFGWPTPETFGKFGGDMVNVLSKAPKQVAGGGKTVFGGVAGLVGGKRPGQSQTNLSRTNTNGGMDSPVHKSTPSMSQSFATDSYPGSMSSARQSQESLRSLPKASSERRGSSATTTSVDLKARPSVSSSRLSSEVPRPETPIVEPPLPSPLLSETQLPGSFDAVLDEAAINLPPPPSEISDDFGSPKHAAQKNVTVHAPSSIDQALSGDQGEPSAPSLPPRAAVPTKAEAKPKEPITERETSVAVELMFAVITELYTLSSAWQIRRTLLAAAKNFLLRPGNPQLITIRDMLQTSLLDENLSDKGVAAQIYKLRVNGLPTAEELEVWNRDYPEKTAEQKEELRIKARRLLVTKGMPQALTSVMGAAASGEALGKVFDCLQVPEIGRGLVFGLVLQALKILH